MQNSLPLGNLEGNLGLQGEDPTCVQSRPLPREDILSLNHLLLRFGLHVET